MRILRRRRSEPVAAELASGFWLTEAPAMQGAIRGALQGRASSRSVVELTFEHGLEGRVIGICRNTIVGFVPESHRGVLSQQIDEAAPRALLIHARLHTHDDEWRIWAGPPWPGDVPPPYPRAQIAPERPHIFGIQLRDHGRN